MIPSPRTKVIPGVNRAIETIKGASHGEARGCLWYHMMKEKVSVCDNLRAWVFDELG